MTFNLIRDVGIFSLAFGSGIILSNGDKQPLALMLFVLGIFLLLIKEKKSKKKQVKK